MKCNSSAPSEQILSERNVLIVERQSEDQVVATVPSEHSTAMDIDAAQGLSEAVNNHFPRKEPPSITWSLLSNFFFLCGSLSYVALGCLAFYIDSHVFSSEASDLPTASPSSEYRDGSRGEQPKWWKVSYYQLVGAIAALWFFGNAIVDLAWAIDDRRNNKEARFGGDDPRWDIGVATTFGLAASLDFFSCVLANYDRDFSSIVLAIAAVHVYLVYALVALSGRRLDFSSLHECLYSAGDVLFLMGSIIDVVMSYFLTTATTVDNWVLYDSASTASALLWTGNAVLCIAADVVVCYHEKNSRSDDLFTIMSSPTDRRREVNFDFRIS